MADPQTMQRLAGEGAAAIIGQQQPEAQGGFMQHCRKLGTFPWKRLDSLTFTKNYIWEE